MARKKIREFDSKRLVKEHFKRIPGSELPIKSAQVTDLTDFNELAKAEPWLSSSKLVVKPDMLFGKRGKSGLVALNLDLAQATEFVKERLDKEVVMGGLKGPITTFIVEPFVPHSEEFYLNIVSERSGCSISFSESGGIDIEQNWDKVKTIFLPTGAVLNQETCAPLVATLPLESGLSFRSERNWIEANHDDDVNLEQTRSSIPTSSSQKSESGFFINTWRSNSCLHKN